MASINLYPPILDSYMPALVDGQNHLDIPMTFSNFGSTTGIKEIQIRISNQSNNKYLAKNSKYGIFYKKVTSLPQSGKYIVRLSEEDNINFNTDLVLNEYNRIQIRFSLTQYDNDNQNEQSYLSNTDNFSEWSSIMLFKKIPQSTAILTNGLLGFTTATQYLSTLDILEGYIKFNSDTDEYLYNYRIKILDELNNVVEDSGIINANIYELNRFNYNIKTVLEMKKLYIIYFEYNTNNNYTANFTNRVIIDDTREASFLKKHIEDSFVTPNIDKGCLEVKIKFKGNYRGKVAIKRASSKFNFNKADDIRIEIFNTLESQDYVFEDYTVESGIMYKYCVQEIASSNERSAKIWLNGEKNSKDEIDGSQKSAVAAMVELDDIFLTDKNNILKVRLDPNIDSYKINVNDNILTTIGSKYPYAVRSTENYYKTYSMGGLISFEADIVNNILDVLESQSVMTHRDDEKIVDDNFILLQEEKIKTHLFADLTKLFVSKENVNKFLELINNREKNNFTIERLFRDLVYEFLNNGKAKLFRSPSEGNAIVYLTDISLTPRTDIMNRLLYSFSATVTEIDESSIDNYKNYEIIDWVVDNDKEGEDFVSYVGQVKLSPGENLLNILNDKYCSAVNNYIKNKIISIDWIRVDMGKNGGTLYINLNKIVLPNNSPYFEAFDINIESLNCEEDAIIDYKITLGQEIIFTEKKTLINIENKIGQIKETIAGDTSLVQLIKDKITRNNTDKNIELMSIYKIIIETKEAAFFGIQDMENTVREDREIDSIPFSHITFKDNTEHYFIELYDKDSVFNEIIYRGVPDISEESRTPLPKNPVKGQKYIIQDYDFDVEGAYFEDDILVLPNNNKFYFEPIMEDNENYQLVVKNTKNVEIYYDGERYWTVDKLPDLEDVRVITKPIEVKFTYFYTVGRVANEL